jgi:holo-[acyl-carrier protein] synthase
MMMQSIGIDIIEIARIKQAIAHWGEAFLCRVYTDQELKLYRKSIPSLAARFAGKEAVVKLFGARKTGIKWCDIEILPRPSGQPFVNLYRQAKSEARELRLQAINISLSHSKEYAVAAAIGIQSGS